MAEDERRPVADLRLHGDDGRQTLAHQRLTDAGEGVAARGPRSLTGVEHGKLQVAGVVQQGAQPRPRHPVRRAVVALQDEHSLVELAVETAVSDEVEHVEGVEQRSLQARQGGIVEDDDLEQAGIHEVLGGRLQQLTLPVDGERGNVSRAGDHHQHPQWCSHDHGWWHAESLDLTHDRGLVRQRDEAAQLRRVEVLPRHRLQVGGSLQIEAQADDAARPGRCLDLGRERRPHGTREERVTETLAELPDVAHAFGHRDEAAGGEAGRTDGDHEGRELGGAERQGEWHGQWSAVRRRVTGEAHGVAAVAVRDDDVEVDVALAHLNHPTGTRDGLLRGQWILAPALIPLPPASVLLAHG